MEKAWLIISYAHKDHMDGAFGQLIMKHEGTYEDAIKMAKDYAWAPTIVLEDVCAM